MNPDVLKLLMGNGKQRGRKPVYRLNESSFKEPLSPLALYFLGILYTDGCLWREGNASYRLQLGLIDYDVVDKFIEFLQYTGIAQIEKKDKNPRKIVQITSERLGQSLVDLGITPAKTHTTEVPERIKDSRDFWRGVIDGDGSLMLNGGYSFSLSLRTASEKFADQFVSFGLSHSIKVGKSYDTCYKLSVYGDNAHNLSQILYKDCCFAMGRKLLIYSKYNT